MSVVDFPGWVLDAYVLRTAARAQGWRVWAFRLTPEQANEWARISPVADMLWGVPVLVKGRRC